MQWQIHTKRIRIGTRGSAMALAQAGMVADALSQRHPGLETELVRIRTTGDRKQATREERDKRDWIEAIEEVLLRGEIHVAVHSGKDVPVDINPATALSSVLSRSSPWDALVLRDGVQHTSACGLSTLPRGARVGTSSARRQAELLRLRSDVEIVSIRGNVPTRLRCMEQGESGVSALVLAQAGLERLGLTDWRTHVFTAEEFLPSVCQGILIAQWRKGDVDIKDFFASLVDLNTESALRIEREVVRTLGADCRSALGVFAEVDGPTLRVRARVLSSDGTRMIEGEKVGVAREAVTLGVELGHELLSQGAQTLLGG